MKTYVVDASVVAKWYFLEPGSDLALQFLDKLKVQEKRLVAPDLLLYEVGNIVWRRTRALEISRDVGETILSSLRQAPINLVEPSVLVDDGFRIAHEVGITLYDAPYIALAAGLKTTVVTADERLVNACRNTDWHPYVTSLYEWHA